MVSLIIHVTRKENFETIKHAGQLFVDTFNPGDHASVHFNTLYQFNPANSTKLKRFINQQSFNNRSGSSARDVFAEVFQAFYSYHEQFDAQNVPCHNVLLFLSDSPLYDNLTNEIGDLQKAPRVDIFTYTFNIPIVDPTVPQAIACAFRGAWLGTGSSIDNMVTAYLSFYSKGLSHSEITWSGVIEDVLSQRNIFSGCLPAYWREGTNHTNSVDIPLGVVCIDVDAEKFQQLEGGTEVRYTV